MRNLKVSDSINLNGHKEFNHLRIKNLKRFFDVYENNLNYFETPFSIFAELEKRILFENNPEECILISYKEEGDVIFDLERIYELNNLRIVEYSFRTFVS
jgi:hypothetical protein